MYNFSLKKIQKTKTKTSGADSTSLFSYLYELMLILFSPKDSAKLKMICFYMLLENIQLLIFIRSE